MMKFKIMIDLSYRGTDFQNGLTKILTKSSEIYDLLHMSSWGGLVHVATVNIFPDEILEGEKLYLIGCRIEINATKTILQV